MYNGYKKELGLRKNVQLACENERAIPGLVLRSLFPQMNYYSTIIDVAKQCNLPKKIVINLGYGYYGRSISTAPNRSDLIRVIQALRTYPTPVPIAISLPEIQKITEDNVDMVYSAHFCEVEQMYRSDFTENIFSTDNFLKKLNRNLLGVDDLDTRVASFMDYLYYHQPVFAEFMDHYGKQTVLDEFLHQRMDRYIKRMHLPIHAYKTSYTKEDYYDFLDSLLDFSLCYQEEDVLTYSNASPNSAALETLLASPFLGDASKKDLTDILSSQVDSTPYPKSMYAVTPLLQALSPISIDYAPILNKLGKDYNWLYRTLDLENGYGDFLLLLDALFKEMGYDDYITIHAHDDAIQFFSLEFTNFADAHVMEKYRRNPMIFTSGYPLYANAELTRIYAYFTTDSVTREEVEKPSNLSRIDDYAVYILH